MNLNPVEKDRFVRENIGLAKKLASMIDSRLRKCGIAMQFADLQQEMVIQMLKAIENFDESTGFKFSTFYYKVALNNFNREVDTIIQREKPLFRIDSFSRDGEGRNLEEVLDLGQILSEEMIAKYLEEEEEESSVWDELDAWGEENASDVSLADPFEALAREQEVKQRLKCLSPLAKKVLEWMNEPPSQFIKELRCVQAKKEYARKMGLRVEASSTDISFDMVERVLVGTGAFSKDEFASAKREIRRLAGEV